MKLARQKFQDPEKLPTFSVELNPIHAYYRLIADNDDKYIFIACHVNVHGFHRADLRFVEVNDKTIVKGLEAKSVIGQLFLGDLVAVTELKFLGDSESKNLKMNISRVHQDTPCTWQVAKMTILKRRIRNHVKFAFLPNLRTAVVMGCNEAFGVRNENKQNVTQERIYWGRAFIPEQFKYSFTQVCFFFGF